MLNEQLQMLTLPVFLTEMGEVQVSCISRPLPPYGRVGKLSIVWVGILLTVQIVERLQHLIDLPLTDGVKVNH